MDFLSVFIPEGKLSVMEDLEIHFLFSLGLYSLLQLMNSGLHWHLFIDSLCLRFSSGGKTLKL